jgi:hypothetical protein
MYNAEQYVRLLAEAPRDKWVAFSEDESRIVGIGDTMDEAISAAAKEGVEEPVLIKTPIEWGPRVLWKEASSIESSIQTVSCR